MDSNNSINGDPSRSLSLAASLSDVGTISNNNEEGETRIAAPLPFNDGRRFEVLNNEEKESEDLESAATCHYENVPPQFVFSSLAVNEFSGFVHRTIRQEDEISQSPLTSHDSRSTLASTSTTDAAVEMGRLTHGHSSSLFSQGSDEANTTTSTNHLSDGTPEIEAPNIEEVLPAEVPAVAPMSDHERRIFFKNAFKHALVQAYQETDDSKITSTSSMKGILTSVFHQQDIAGIAVHATVLTRLREYCDRIEAMITGDPENERSLHHAFRSAIEAAYIESVAAGASPVAAAKSAMRTAREYISHQAPVFDGLIASESTVHDWFTAVADITPHVIRNRSAQNTTSSSSSSTDRSAQLNELYNMALAIFFHDVHQNFDAAVGDVPPPPYLNRVCNDMAIAITRFANRPGAIDVNAAARSIDEANHVLGRAFQGIAIEVTNLRTAESAAAPIFEAEPANENFPVVADAILIGPQQNAAVVMDDDGPVVAERIPEDHFVDPHEEG